MTDWYYHAPGRGKVGPLSADEMRAHYRSRQIGRDTLAWHEGLREWQPLERLIEELGLTGVAQDMRQPPPVPPPPAATASHASATRRNAEPPPSRRTGCLIAAVVLVVGGLAVLGFLAAVAVPAYQDYLKRAKAVQAAQPKSFDADEMADADARARRMVTEAMRTFYAANGNTCPDELEFEKVQLRDRDVVGPDGKGWGNVALSKSQDGMCAYTVDFHGLGPDVENRTVNYAVSLRGADVDIVCTAGTLTPPHLPPHCMP